MARNSTSPDAFAEPLDPRVVRSRAAVLGAAREILFEEGWDAVTHASVAARSGVGRTTLYRHWPDATALIRDVIAEQIAITRIVPTGNLREDLVSQLEAFRLQLHDPGMERAIRVIIERAGVHPVFADMKENLYQEGSRVFREILRQAKAAGEVDARLDIGRAIDQLAGPLVYRRFLAGRTFTTAYVRHVVDDFLVAHAPRVPADTPPAGRGGGRA
jgi:AcrR family transcriptional regulator